MNFRSAEYLDFEGVMLLLIRNGLKIRCKENWENLWKKNPSFDKSIDSKGIVCEVNNKIIGYFGWFPMKYHLHNKEIKALASHTFVIDDSYRSIFLRFIKEFFNQKKINLYLMTTVGHSGMNKIFSLYNSQKVPVELYNRPLYYVLKYDKVVIYIYKKISRIIRILPQRPILYVLNIFAKIKRMLLLHNESDKIHRYYKFNDKFDKFWEIYLNHHHDILLFNRSMISLQWHFGHLIIENGWVQTYEKNSQILGYIICIEEIGDIFRKVNIVDIIAIGDSPNEIYKSLFNSSILLAYKGGYDIIELVGFNKNIRKTFKKYFPINRKFSVCPYLYNAKTNELKNILTNPKYWIPSMIDGDASI